MTVAAPAGQLIFSLRPAAELDATLTALPITGEYAVASRDPEASMAAGAPGP